MTNINDDWIPTVEKWESPTKTIDPQRYSRRCERIRRSRSRKRARRISTLFTGSLALLAFVAVLSLLIG